MNAMYMSVLILPSFPKALLIQGLLDVCIVHFLEELSRSPALLDETGTHWDTNVLWKPQVSELRAYNTASADLVHDSSHLC